MPGPLGTIATWNPLTATATAIRDLFGNPRWDATGWATEHSVQFALAWPAILTIIFAPLAAHQYRALAK
jgi:ABC-2 type transport system permease protein